MIYIKDNFLPLPLYKELVNFCDEFTEVKTPGKSFWIKEVPTELTHYIERSLEELDEIIITPITFYSQSNDF